MNQKQDRVGASDNHKSSFDAIRSLLTHDEAAQLLAVKSRTLRLWRRTRGLPHIKITSKEIRYRRADLDAWLDRRRTVIAS
ncbi:MAG: helix-turn-helix domain-containing protein [Verrucomicrobia bacterium]|nr:helix-turn-helix domain-containing protein [Verrucomicrobiota bacterium]